MTKAKILATIRWLLIFAFGGLGILKLIGASIEVEIFTRLGTEAWMRYLTGVIELGAALLLLRDRSALFGITLMVLVTIGATITQLAILQGSFIAPLFLMVLALYWGWQSQNQTTR